MTEEETEIYLRERASAHSRVIDESMNRKIGIYMKQRDMMNPERAVRTQSEYSPHDW